MDHESLFDPIEKAVLVVLFTLLVIFVAAITKLQISDKAYDKGIQEGIRITREEAIEKQLGYFVITNQMTGGAAFYWLSREETNTVESKN